MFNSIVVGILLAAIVYLYLWWKNEEDHKKDPESTKKPVNYIIPCVVGVFGWFLSSFYFDGNFFPSSSDNTSESSQVSEIITTHKESLLASKSKNNPIGNPTTGNPTPTGGNTGGNTDNSESYRLIGTKRVTLPTTDVFIDLAKF